MTNAGPDKRTRKRASDRIPEILDMVDARLAADRSANIAMKDIGDAVGASRALVYAYFPDQFRLLDAILDRHIQWLIGAGLPEAAEHGPLIKRASACAAIYMRHILTYGPALEIVLREAPVARQLSGAATHFRGRIYRSLANVTRTELKMGPREALTLVQLLAVIPEEGARLVAAGSVTLDEALELNQQLIDYCVEALRPNPART